MTPIEDFFSHIVVVNLARRGDRWQHVLAEMKAMGVTRFDRFEAIDAGPDDGNRGCTASHRAVMDMIVQAEWPKCLVFEDDFAARFPDTQDVFRSIQPHIPADWQMLYLGGGYGEKPQGWASKHVIRIGAMKTTSSYAVTLEAARILRDTIPTDTCDSIDNLYAGFNSAGRCYITEPRLFVQYNNYSDLQKRVMNNAPSMEDRGHTDALGKFNPP